MISIEKVWTKYAAVAACLLMLLITGCGSSSSGSDSTSSVSGVAAGSAAIEGKVYAFLASNTTSPIGSADIASDGSFSIPVDGYTGPFLLKAMGIVNDQPTTLFAMAEGIGSQNITPVEDAILATSLGCNTADYFDSNSTIPSPGEKIAAIAVQRAAVLPIIKAVMKNAPASFDPAKDTFDVSDEEGFDLVLRTLQFQYDESSKGLKTVDRVSGTVLVPDGNNTQCIENLQGDYAKMVSLWKRLETLYADKNATTAELEADGTGIKELLALPSSSIEDEFDAFLHSGMDVTAFIGNASNMFQQGFKFLDLSVLRPMKELTDAQGSKLINEHGNWDHGVWASVKFFDGKEKKATTVGFVFNSTGSCFVYGNRIPVPMAHPDTLAQHVAYMEQDQSRFYSGLNLYFAGADQLKERNIDKLAVFGPGLSGNLTIGAQSKTGGLLLTRNGYNEFAYAANSYAYKNYIYTQDDGLNLSKLSNNDEYIFLGVDSNGNIRTTFTRALGGKPAAVTDLKATSFAQISDINSKGATHDISAITNATLALAWSTPADLTSYKRRVGYSNTNGGTTKLYDTKGEGSHTFTLVDFDDSSSLAAIRLYAKDVLNRKFRTVWTLEKANATDTITFATTSDPHLYNPELGTTGTAFQTYLMHDRKLLVESPAIIKQAHEMIVNSTGVKFMLVSGDLTKDGTLLSHTMYRDMLRDLADKGIRSYVVPGNHDVNNPHAYKYEGANKTLTDYVTPEKFKEIYYNMGYADSLYQDPNSLSYVTEPASGIWLVAMDSCQYDTNFADNYPKTAGRFTNATYEWIKGMVKKGAEQNKLVIGMMHHGLLEHWKGQSLMPGLGDEYVITGWQQYSKELADLGMRMVFTGHYHSQDAVRSDITENGNAIYDIETGSLATHPCPIRLVNLQNNGTIQVSTKEVETISYDQPYTLANGTTYDDFAGYKKGYLEFGLNVQAPEMLKAVAAAGGGSMDNATATLLGQGLAVPALVAHYEGDENVNPGRAAGMAGIAYYLGNASDPLQVQFNQTLQSLWTDFAPDDKNFSLEKTEQ